jgi:hypothetical protein
MSCISEPDSLSRGERWSRKSIRGLLGFVISNGTGTFILSLIGMMLSIFLGVKGNQMIAKNYLKYGWKFVNPNNNIVKTLIAFSPLNLL